jgi:D-arabinono-1,4-lactone oxidase
MARAGGGGLVSLSGRNGTLNHVVNKTMTRMRQAPGGTIPADQFRTVTRFMDFSDVTGDIYQILCKGIPVPQVNLEVAVPLRHFGRVQRKLREWHLASAPRLHYPIILRATGPSTAWLSPAYRRESCYYGFVAYLAEDGSIPGDALEHFRGLQRMLADAGGRPHWGKYFDPDLYRWGAMYDKWGSLSGSGKCWIPLAASATTSFLGCSARLRQRPRRAGRGDALTRRFGEHRWAQIRRRRRDGGTRRPPRRQVRRW